MAIYEINDRTFEHTINSQVPVLIDFWGDNCIPCKIMEPVLNELQSRFKGKIAIHKVNIKSCPRAVERFNVMSLPTLMLFKKGKPVEKFIGFIREPMLSQKIGENL